MALVLTAVGRRAGAPAGAGAAGPGAGPGRPGPGAAGPEASAAGVAGPGPGAELGAASPRRAGGWTGGTVHDRGTVVVVQGPRFSTRAESRWYSAAEVDVINMTQYPEAYLARELGLCYAGLALVTDRDVGVEGDPDRQPVTMEAAMAVLAANVEQTRRLLSAVVPTIPIHPGCRCRVSGAPSLRP